MNRFWALALAALLALSAQIVVSQEDVDPASEEAVPSDAGETFDDVTVPEPPLTSSPHVSTLVLFHESPLKRFVVSSTEPVEVLVGLANNGQTTLNVTSIQASLMYPQDHRYFIQNYTRFTYVSEVAPKQEATFLYKFLPDPGLDARNFDLTISIFYHDGVGGNFTTVAFNDTISMVDSDSSVDAQAFFTYVGGLALVVLAGFVVYKNFFAAPTKKKGARRPVQEVGTRDLPAEQNEWLQGTAAVRRSPRSPARARAASPAKSASK